MNNDVTDEEFLKYRCVRENESEEQRKWERKKKNWVEIVRQ